MSQIIPTTPAERVKHFRQTTGIYTDEGWARLERHTRFIQHIDKNCGKDISLRMISIASVGMGAIMGIKTGLSIGRKIEKAIQIPSDSKKSGLIPLAGGVTGFFIGGVWGGYVYSVGVERSPVFKEWKSKCVAIEFKAAITSNYGEDIILNDFICPISACIMEIPAHTPYGHVIDFMYLVNCAREDNEYIKDPYRNDSFPESQIEIDVEMALMIKKRIFSLMNHDMNSLKNNLQLKTSLKSEIDPLKQSILDYYETARRLIEDRRIKKITSIEQYEEEIKDFKQLFGPSAEADLDWSLNWNDILKIRWKYFHPNAVILDMPANNRIDID